MMASGDRKYPYFQNLRRVAATVSNDVKEIERKIQKSKFELPENNAMFKLVHLSDEMEIYQNDTHAVFQKLTGENQKYAQYHQDIESLVGEMERNIDQVEDFLIGYGYQKWNLENRSMDDSDQLPSDANSCTPVKEMFPAIGLVTENKKQFALPKTPVLADYGLTAKIPKHLPSALKDKQESAVKFTKKQVHFESPGRHLDFREKENKAPYSLQKTPLLSDYGLPSRKRNQQTLDTIQGKDSLGIKKHLNFRSPLGSISDNGIQRNIGDALAVVEVDNTEEFGKLVCSFPSGLKNPTSVAISKAPADVKVCTPEEPLLACSQRMKFAGGKKDETVTPEEPEIQPVRFLSTLKIKDNSETPEEPVATPLSYPHKDTELQTPKTPEFQPTSSFRQWLLSQKKN